MSCAVPGNMPLSPVGCRLYKSAWDVYLVFRLESRKTRAENRGPAEACAGSSERIRVFIKHDPLWNTGQRDTRIVFYTDGAAALLQERGATP